VGGSTPKKLVGVGAECALAGGLRKKGARSGPRHQRKVGTLEYSMDRSDRDYGRGVSPPNGGLNGKRCNRETTLHREEHMSVLSGGASGGRFPVKKPPPSTHKKKKPNFKKSAYLVSVMLADGKERKGSRTAEAIDAGTRGKGGKKKSHVAGVLTGRRPAPFYVKRGQMGGPFLLGTASENSRRKD